MKPAERRRARQFAVQAIYQWQITQAGTSDIIEQFSLDQDLSKTDVPYFKESLIGVVQYTQEDCNTQEDCKSMVFVSAANHQAARPYCNL